MEYAYFSVLKAPYGGAIVGLYCIETKIGMVLKPQTISIFHTSVISYQLGKKNKNKNKIETNKNKNKIETLPTRNC